MITKQNDWNKWVANNQDPYGKACIDVAREVMNVLDKDEPFDPHQIINDADKQVKAGGITGFMAGMVAQIVGHCHSRGEEFRTKWNESYGAKDVKGTVNPAILHIK